tara:strand:+ start:191 stop:478 length:288 start_codon:yes stop_codon:yes gene_type:complete
MKTKVEVFDYSSMNENSKTKDVLTYLQNNKKGITSMEAINMFGATRLAAIIFELRKKYMIDDLAELVPTRYKKKNGEPRMATVSRYILSAYRKYQ